MRPLFFARSAAVFMLLIRRNRPVFWATNVRSVPSGSLGVVYTA